MKIESKWSSYQSPTKNDNLYYNSAGSFTRYAFPYASLLPSGIFFLISSQPNEIFFYVSW